MTDSDKLELILSDMQKIKQDVAEIKQDVNLMKQDVSRIDKRITGVELHLENGTDKNIQLIAENFIELTKKLNQAIPVACSRTAA